MTTKKAKGANKKNEQSAAATVAPTATVSNTIQIALIGLAAIVAATQDEKIGFAWVGTVEAEELAKQGFVETNPNVTNTPPGYIATRALDKGIAHMNAEAAKALGFEIESGIAPSKRRGGGRIGQSKYPFDKLEVGQSFFVATEPAKLASTVANANKRYATEKVVDGNVVTRTNRKGKTVAELVYSRRFTVQAAQKGDVKGSRVFRVATA